MRGVKCLTIYNNPSDFTVKLPHKNTRLDNTVQAFGQQRSGKGLGPMSGSLYRIMVWLTDSNELIGVMDMSMTTYSVSSRRCFGRLSETADRLHHSTIQDKVWRSGLVYSCTGSVEPSPAVLAVSCKRPSVQTNNKGSSPLWATLRLTLADSCSLEITDWF